MPSPAMPAPPDGAPVTSAEAEPAAPRAPTGAAGASPRRGIKFDLPCPSCGYNLRGTVSPRCPECGTAVSVAASLSVSLGALTWGFFRTYAIAAIRPGAFARVDARWIDRGDALRFMMIAAGASSVLFAGIVTLLNAAFRVAGPAVDLSPLIALLAWDLLFFHGTPGEFLSLCIVSLMALLAAGLLLAILATVAAAAAFLQSLMLGRDERGTWRIGIIIAVCAPPWAALAAGWLVWWNQHQGAFGYRGSEWDMAWKIAVGILTAWTLRQLIVGVLSRPSGHASTLAGREADNG